MVFGILREGLIIWVKKAARQIIPGGFLFMLLALYVGRGFLLNTLAMCGIVLLKHTKHTGYKAGLIHDDAGYTIRLFQLVKR